MPLLISVTILWAFSFSLIGHVLAGAVDGYLAVSLRMLLATLIFIPFISKKGFSCIERLSLMSIGAVQIGLMYLFLYHSFLFLSVAEVLLFTITTPIYVVVVEQLLKQCFTLRWLAPAILAVIGAAVIRYQQVNEYFYLGFILVQAANVCFAIGQVWYRHQFSHAMTHIKHAGHAFAHFFFGALIVSSVCALLFGNMQKLPTTTEHYITLLWLGLIASGIGYLGWNWGAARVNISTLATMNNMLIPAGLLVELIFWSQTIQWTHFILGGCIITLSVYWAQKQRV